MPQILLAWLAAGLLALLWGKLLDDFSRRWFPAKPASSLWMYFWTGLALLSVFLSIVTFFFPLDPAAKSLLWPGLFLPVLFRPSALKEVFRRMLDGFSRLGIPGWLLFGLGAGTGLLKSAGLPEIFDEGAYHLPLIRMWEQQGLVAGIANLNGHYGLHSVWHLLSAFTNPDFIPGMASEMSLNGLLAALLALFAGSRLQELLQYSSRFRLSSLAAVFLPALLFRNLLSSPSTDIPAIAGSWFFFLLWLEAMEKGEPLRHRWDLFLVLPVWIVTVKSSTAGLLTVCLFFLLALRRNKENRALVFSLSAALLAGGIWVLQNWLISGYAVFPLGITALGSPPWQVTAECIQKKFYLEQFGAFAPPESYSLAWLKTWISAQNPDSRLIIFLALFFFLLVPLLLRKKAGFILYSGFYFLLLLQAGIWFFTITEPRYGFGALVISALLLPALLLQKLFLFKPGWRRLMLLILLPLLFNLVKTSKEYLARQPDFMRPAAVPSVSYRMLSCGNFQASFPQRYTGTVPAGKPVFCWDCPFPCLPLEGGEDSAFVFKGKNACFTYFYFDKTRTNKP